MNDEPYSDRRPEDDPDLAGYIVTDEFRETVSGLNHLDHLLCLVKSDSHCWKWVILCAHNILQNAAVCLLTETYGGGALTEKSQFKLLDRLNRDSDSTEPWPPERLADFPELMTRISKKTSIRYPAEPDWKEFDQGTDLARLHNYRNEFTHFKPKSWLIEIEGLPRILNNAVNATKEITESSSYSVYNRFCESELSPVFASIRSKLSVLSKTT